MEEKAPETGAQSSARLFLSRERLLPANACFPRTPASRERLLPANASFFPANASFFPVARPLSSAPTARLKWRMPTYRVCVASSQCRLARVDLGRWDRRRGYSCGSNYWPRYSVAAVTCGTQGLTRNGMEVTPMSS